MEVGVREQWLELLTDLSRPAVYWQLVVIATSLLAALVINKVLRRQLVQHGPATWRMGIASALRLLFPVVSLVLIHLGASILKQMAQHTSMLKLVSSLLVALAIIRVCVYALRYVFPPSAWLRSIENAVGTAIWGMVALHLTGLLPELISGLDAISFTLGKNTISLWMVLQALAIVAVTLIAALFLSRFLENKLMHADKIDMNLRVVFSKLLRVFLIVMAVLMALSAIGFDMTLLSVFGGALGVGLGLGLQKISSNYVSGFIILLDRSVHMGDVMTINEHHGVIYQIRSRYLVLRKLDGTEVIIPNEMLVSSVVVNHSLTDRRSRILIPVQISYDSPVELAIEIMQQAAMRHPRVLADPKPEAQVAGFGESGIDLNLSIWIEDPEQGTGALKSVIYLEIWAEFKKLGISIPFPQREVRVIADSADS